MSLNTQSIAATDRGKLNVGWLGVLLGIVVVLALIGAAALALQGDEYSTGIAPRADANPSMNVARWYVPAEVNGALLASQSLQRDANPSMDVARWYAPIEANGALLASRALSRDANPSMDVARWYAPAEVNGALLANQVLHRAANPSMNVALWYAPVESSAELLLCLADSAVDICQ